MLPSTLTERLGRQAHHGFPDDPGGPCRSGGSDDYSPRVPSPALVCQVCGTPSPSDPPPLGWSGGVDAGRTTWICESCARLNMRGIEGKLDPEWW